MAIGVWESEEIVAVVESKLLRLRLRLRFCFGCVDGDEVGRVAMEVEKEARWPRE